MRCDLFLFRQGFAASRSQARVLIESGSVIVNGKTVSKPSEDVDENAENQVEILETLPFVSRGGTKLDFALEAFGLSVDGLSALDVGASTGGFTDCLLKRGASRVVAVDSGENQMAKQLREDERVICMEKYNARYMTAGDLPFAPDVAVMDVSFISQTLILAPLASVMAGGGLLVSLIKPQFEVGRSAVGKKGIVKKASDRAEAIRRVVSSGASCGLGCFGLVRSPITGGDGNVEFLAAFRKGAPLSVTEKEIKKITEGQS